MNKKRHNICLLVAKITDFFSSELAKGAMDAAKQMDVNLTIIPGNYVGAISPDYSFDKDYDYQYNVLFKYAAQAHFDYVIAAMGTIAYSSQTSDIEKFLKTFRDTHVLCVASKVGNYEHLVFDNKPGIISAIDFLVAQGRRKIGLLAGHPDNVDCAERHDAYREGLEKNGIAYDEKYVRFCGISYDSGKDAEAFLNECPDLDAIVCVNDVIAQVLYEVLEKRGTEIGKDIAVVGFDDHPAAINMEPPLATVRADARLMGNIAVKKTVSHLENTPYPINTVETEFVPRHSCFNGMNALQTPADLFEGTPDDMKERLKEYIKLNLPDLATKERLYDAFSDFLDFIDDSFVKNIADENTKNIILEKVHHLLTSDLYVLKGLSRMYAIHEVAYLWLIRCCRPENIAMVREIYDILKKSFTRKKTTDKIGTLDRSHLENIFIRDSLTVGLNLRSSYADILKRLCNIGSVTSYLYVLSKPVIHNFGFDFPDDVMWLFKSYSYGANVVSVPENEQKMFTNEVFKNSFLVSDRPRILIATVLFSASTQYGLALFEPENDSFFREIELVTYQLSSAVRTLNMLQELNGLLVDVNDRNSELENQSRTDDLTRVYNRRGFYLAAEELIENTNAWEDDFVVCYTDTDDLKSINNSYGHFQGDFTIKLTSDCLRHAFGKNALIGRMGGGEFVAVIRKSQIISVDDVVRRKDRFISDFNVSKMKPYKFGISIGLAEKKLHDRADLDIAIEQACERILANKNAL